MPELDRDTARGWIERWDRQQEESLPDREDRFTALIDAVEEALAAHVAERGRRHVEAGHHDSESSQLATHVDALRAAGFTEIGTLWQRGDNRLLCAVLPAGAHGRRA